MTSPGGKTSLRFRSPNGPGYNRARYHGLNSRVLCQWSGFENEALASKNRRVLR